MSKDHWVIILAALLLLLTFHPSAARQDTPTPTATYMMYTVQTGDTLGLIASRYHVTIVMADRIRVPLTCTLSRRCNRVALAGP